GHAGVAGRMSEDPHRSLVGRDDVEDHPDGGRLAGAVGAEQAVHRTGGNGERQIANGDVVGESLDDALKLDSGLGHGTNRSGVEVRKVAAVDRTRKTDELLRTSTEPGRCGAN